MRAFNEVKALLSCLRPKHLPVAVAHDVCEIAQITFICICLLQMPEQKDSNLRVPVLVAGLANADGSSECFVHAVFCSTKW